jgi:hypothetical protein
VCGNDLSSIVMCLCKCATSMGHSSCRSLDVSRIVPVSLNKDMRDVGWCLHGL